MAKNEKSVTPTAKNDNATQTDKVANVETSTAQPTAKIAESVTELTSDKLTELTAKWSDAKKAARDAEPDSPEEEKAWQDAYAIKKQIDAEKLHLAQEQRNLAVVEKRNAIKADFDKMFDAHKAAILSVNNEDLSLEQKQAISGIFTGLYDSYLNKLQGGIVTPRAATATGDKPAGNGTRGATSSAIRALIAPMFASGKTGSEVRSSIIKEHGFNDGTANDVILKYEYEIGLKTPPVKS